MWPFRQPGATALVAARARRLAGAADRLAVTSAWLRERERGLDERELHLRARLQRDTADLDERADALAALARELRARELRARELEDELQAREARLLVDELGARERRREPNGPPANAPSVEAAGCVLFVPSSEGYRLVPVEVAPPRAGQRVELDGAAFHVLRVGRSPLPGDDRPCAFLGLD